METFPLEEFCTVWGFDKYEMPSGLANGYSMFQTTLGGILLTEVATQGSESPQAATSQLTSC